MGNLWSITLVSHSLCVLPALASLPAIHHLANLEHKHIIIHLFRVIKNMSYLAEIILPYYNVSLSHLKITVATIDHILGNMLLLLTTACYKSSAECVNCRGHLFCSLYLTFL